jgi:hypothetical protein
MQVRPANRAGGEPDDGIIWLLNRWFSHVFQPDIAYSTKNHSFHVLSFDKTLAVQWSRKMCRMHESCWFAGCEIVFVGRDRASREL